MLGIGVVGCGYWGPKIVRNFQSLDGCETRALFDLDPSRVERVRKVNPALRAAASFQEFLEDSSIDAVAICTPVHTHHALASQALNAGKHVLIEKPLTHSVETAQALVELAESKRLILQVDHTFVYSGAVQKTRELIASGQIGDILYVDFVRVNLGLFQADVNVLWDLAPHDISILTYLIDQKPLWVSAIGSAHYGKFEDQVYVTIMYDEPLIAHLHVNWLAPVKLRSTLIGGSQQMIVYDDLEPSEKIRVYEKGVTVNGDSADRERALVDYRMGDMFAPYVDKTEPLEQVCRSFLEAVDGGAPPLTDGRAGLAVVQILEAAQQSIRNNGERVLLQW